MVSGVSYSSLGFLEFPASRPSLKLAESWVVIPYFLCGFLCFGSFPCLGLARLRLGQLGIVVSVQHTLLSELCY